MADPLLVDGRYRLEAELGRGAMGVVHAGRDLELDRPIAVKIINPVLTRDPSVAAQFRTEARALASVRSEHVVRVYTFGVHLGRSYFTMELVLGQPLTRLLDAQASEGRFTPIGSALGLLEQVARGLDAVHAAGLIHRDVKPDNVLLEEGTGRPVLVDFGLALSAMAMSGEYLPAGTPAYMPPEQIAGGRVGPPTDVYALACTAYELLTNRLPFEGAMHEVCRAQLLDDPPPPSRWRPELAALDAAFARALAKDPAQRHRTCSALAAALTSAAGATMRAPVVPDPPAEVEPRPLVTIVTTDATLARSAARAAGLALFGSSPRVLVAATAAEMMARLDQAAPRLVILDGSATAADGARLTAHVRGLPGSATTAIVALGGGDERAGGPAARDPAVPAVDFPDLLRAIEAALRASGVRTGAAPERARPGPPPVTPRRGPAG